MTSGSQEQNKTDMPSRTVELFKFCYNCKWHITKLKMVCVMATKNIHNYYKKSLTHILLTFLFESFIRRTNVPCRKWANCPQNSWRCPSSFLLGYPFNFTYGPKRSRLHACDCSGSPFYPLSLSLGNVSVDVDLMYCIHFKKLFPSCKSAKKNHLLKWQMHPCSYWKWTLEIHYIQFCAF